MRTLALRDHHVAQHGVVVAVVHLERLGFEHDLPVRRMAPARARPRLTTRRRAARTTAARRATVTISVRSGHSRPILDAACRPSNRPACRRASSSWPDQRSFTGASVSMNSVGVLMRRLSVVSDSGSPPPRRRAGDAHVAVQLDVVAVGAHLAVIGGEMPDFARRLRGGSPALRRQLACALRVVVHLQVARVR